MKLQLIKKTIGTLLVLSLISCGDGLGGEKEAVSFFTASAASYSPFVNQKSLPKDVDLTSDITFLNRDYPIEIALYKNGEFFYDLPNLGTGRGTYKHEDGKIHLFAKRTLFNMNIEVIASNEDATEFVLRFRDRFGVRVLPTEKMNLR